MYKIKQQPSDFIVKELSSVNFVDDGNNAIFLLKKINYNTLDAVRKIADFLYLKLRQVGYAGTKDKVAVTEQYISVDKRFKERVEKFSCKGIELQFKGYAAEPLFLGDLAGNEFEIVVRNIDAAKFVKKYEKLSKIKIVNYFGEQRFSENNAEVGELIVVGDFKGAVKLIESDNDKLKHQFEDYLATRENDFVGALKTVPDKLLKLFVHAYQSKLWNDIVKEFVGKKDFDKLKDMKVPVLGFGTDVQDDKLKKIIDKLMMREKITLRSFVIRALPHLSQDGGERDMFVYADCFKILEKGTDFVRISFRLQKGSYATEVVRQMF